MSRVIFADRDLKNKKHVYIIHGYNASPEAHWFPWLKQKLIESEIPTCVLAMPNPGHPQNRAWIDNLKEHIHLPNQKTFFVAHSLGCITLLQYLDTLDENSKIGGVILVSGFSTPLRVLPQLDEFTRDSFDTEKIIKFVQSRSVLAAKDDPIVPYEQTEELARLLQAKFLSLKRGGHFLASDGFIQLPVVYEELQRMFDSV